MGLITGAASIIGVAGKVAGTVLSLGSGALSLGAKFIKNPIGKLLIGAGAAVAISSAISSKGGSEDTLFGKIRSGFSGLWDTVKSTVGKFVGTTAAKAQVAMGSVAEATETRESLESMIANDSAVFESGGMQIGASAIPVAEEQTVEQEAPAAEAVYGA